MSMLAGTAKMVQAMEVDGHGEHHDELRDER